MSFDHYFNTHMSQAPPQIHAWKASFDVATEDFAQTRKKQVFDATPMVIFATKKRTSKGQTSNTNAYVGVTIGVIGLVATGALIASLKKKNIEDDNYKTLV